MLVLHVVPMISNFVYHYKISYMPVYSFTHTPAPPAFPPTPSRPVILRIGSSWVTLGWSEPPCDGGHRIVSFTIQYFEQTTSFFNRVIRLVNKIAVSTSQV